MNVLRVRERANLKGGKGDKSNGTLKLCTQWVLVEEWSRTLFWIFLRGMLKPSSRGIGLLKFIKLVLLEKLELLRQKLTQITMFEWISF